MRSAHVRVRVRTIGHEMEDVAEQEPYFQATTTATQGMIVMTITMNSCSHTAFSTPAAAWA